MSSYFPQEESGADYPGQAQLKARNAALERLVAQKDEALRVLADGDNWTWAMWMNEPPKWRGDSKPWDFAQTALDLKCEEDSREAT